MIELLEIILDILYSCSENNYALNTVPEDKISVLSSEAKPMSTSLSSDEWNDLSSNKKKSTNDSDACKKLIYKVNELNSKQSPFHAFIMIEETNEETNQKHAAFVLGDKYPIIGNKKINGCLSYPGAKK